MLDTWQASSLPLPKGWPDRVRSAVLHAISVAAARKDKLRSR